LIFRQLYKIIFKILNNKLMKRYTELNKQFINGKWLDGNEKEIIENLNPFNNTLINTLRSAGISEVDAAFEAAKTASKTWSATNPLMRRDILLNASRILDDRREEFIEWLIAEVGSTFIKASMEVQQCYNMLIESSSFPTRMHGSTINSTTDGKESFVFRKPIGIVSLISPWNYPAYLSLRTIGPALATGNTMVVKPASQSFVTGGTILAKLLEEAGVPPGVFNVVVGKSNIIGDHFTGHPYSKMISFTGSTPVGKGIGRIAGENLKKSALELGGNNVLIVMENADIEKAVNSAIFGRFMHQGQVCVSTNRIIIHESLYEEFKSKFVKRVKELPFGDPADKKTVVGPVIDHHSITRIQAIIDQSIAAGAIVETGNRVHGNVLEPTVLSNVSRDMKIFTDEVFGPAIGLISFKNDDEAVDLANASEFGLSGAIHTKDIYRGIELAKRIESGMIHINDQSLNDEINSPFGGEKSSGTGRFGGEFILEELTTVQWISVQAQERSYPF